MKPSQVVWFILLPCALCGFLVGGWLAYCFIIHNGLDSQKKSNPSFAFWISIFCCWIMIISGVYSMIRMKKK
jgi:hypothetical protein